MDSRYRTYIRRLTSRLPGWLRRSLNWLLEPGRHWVRVPVGVLFVVLGCFGFLPVLGFWMVPIGVLVLAEDIPWLRRPTIRLIGMIRRWWRRLAAPRVRSRP